MMFELIGAPLAEHLDVPHEGGLTSALDGVVFSEGPPSSRDWQVMRVPLPSTPHSDVQIDIRLELLGRIEPVIYVGQFGARLIGLFDTQSQKVTSGQVTAFLGTRTGSAVTLTLHCTLDNPWFYLGTAGTDSSPIHAGDGKEQFKVLWIRAHDHRLPANSRPKLTVVDVGAAGGIESIWSQYINDIKFILFEPEETSAEDLRCKVSGLPDVEVMTEALAGTDGLRTLYVTKASVCSSLLEPNVEVLSRYSVAPVFEVIKKTSIDCRRYDTLYKAGAPIPDYIKLDTQGTELEILQGFGNLLSRCAGIALEAHLYPIYKGQPLIGEIVEYLDGFGFALRDVRPC